MTTAIVWTTALADAKAAAAALDTHYGYPLAGTNVGGGLHLVPPTVTTTYAGILQHPTLAHWALVIPQSQTAAIQLVLVQAGIVAPNATTLDGTWTPPIGSAPTVAWPTPADITAAQIAVTGTAAQVTQ